MSEYKGWVINDLQDRKFITRDYLVYIRGRERVKSGTCTPLMPRNPFVNSAVSLIRVVA